MSVFTISCDTSDDIDLIFIGKTWYMMGGKLNGTELNSEVSNFYEQGSSGYQLSFQSDAFVGELTPGKKFSGTWKADGKTRDLSLKIKNEASLSSTFDHNIYAVLKDIKYYSGDSKVMTIYADKNNYLRLNFERPNRTY